MHISRSMISPYPVLEKILSECLALTRSDQHVLARGVLSSVAFPLVGSVNRSHAEIEIKTDVLFHPTVNIKFCWAFYSN